MSNPGVALENIQLPASEDFADDLTERIVIGTVKWIIWLWCLPALLIALLVTWTVIVLWRTVLLIEFVAKKLAGRSDKSLFEVLAGATSLPWSSHQSLLNTSAQHNVTQQPI